MAYVGYIAHENIIGISKLTRLVRLFSKRFAVQERIGQQIADALGDHAPPAWGGCFPGSPSSLRGDARGAGNGAHHPHDGLARPLCRGSGPALRILYRLQVAAAK